MRSHDYCHFEVALSADLTGLNSEEMTPAVDEMRKIAARLADKAVEQYKVAKANAARLLGESNARQYLTQRMDTVRAIPEGERTVNQQAELKAFDDQAYHASRPYDYEDDWQEDDKP